MESAVDRLSRRFDGTLGALPPITATLGGKLVSLDERELVCEYVGAPAFVNPAGQVQGGMLCAMLDDVTALLVVSTLDEGEHCATLSLHTSFVRSALPGVLRGRSKLVRRGRGVCNVEGELWQDDRLIATASAVVMVVAPKA